MRSRFLFALFVPCLLLPSACGSGGGKPSAAGKTITVKVDGQTLRFDKCHAKFQSFLGGAWMLDFDSDQGDGTDLSFCFFTDAKTVAELSERAQLQNDYREDNPDRYPNDDIMNFVRVGKKEYQGWHVKGMVRSVTDKQIAIDIEATFIEFPRNWMESTGETPPQGREVQLSASLIVPLEIETP